MVAWLALLGMVSVGSGAPSGEEEALIALAGGREAEAVRLLERSARSAEGDARWPLLCLLGRAQILAGDPAAAARTLGTVPLEARCGRQAAFVRADALRALGQDAEAAALYGALGVAILEEGDLGVLSLLEERASQALAARPARASQALSLLELSLLEEVPLARRVGIAHRMGQVSLEYRLSAPQAAVQVLREGLLRGLGALPDRLLLSRLLPPEAGWSLLSGLSASEPGAAVTRAGVGERLDGELGYALWASLLSSSAEPLLAERVRLSQALLRAGRLGEAAAIRPAAEAVAPGEAATLQWLQARALWQQRQLEASASVLQAYLERFPTGAERASAEALLVQIALQQGREALAQGDAAAAIAAYDALVRRDPRSAEAPVAAYEAALAVRAGGAPRDVFLDRLRELRARWPNSFAASAAVVAEVRTLVLEADDLEGARALAEDASLPAPLRGAAQAELSRQEEKDIQISADGAFLPGKAALTVIARNLPSVEVRIHRIDTEAFLRAGGAPDALPSLDVAVIAPDRTFTHTFSEAPERRDVQEQVPLPIREPGLYAVTVAAPDREARVLLSVGTLSLVARAAGPDLAAGLLEDGRPARGGRLLLASGGEVQELRPDRGGLVRATLPPGPAILLAESGRGVAMMRLDRDGNAEQPLDLQLSAELDRPVYLPGDRVGVRALARRGGTPVTGEWRLWIEAGGARTEAVRLQADARGVLSADLPLPDVAALGRFTIVGQAPGEESFRTLATAAVQPRQAQGPNLSATLASGSGTVQVRDADGVPMPGVAVSWSVDGGPSGVSVSDARGEVQVAVADLGLSWSLQAAVVGGGATTSASWSPWPQETPVLRLVQDRLRPGEAGEAILEGVSDGAPIPLRLRLSRQLLAPEQAPPPVDPWVPELIPELELPPTWIGVTPDAPSPIGEEVVWEQQATLAPETEQAVRLPADLVPGRYVLRAVSEDGRRTQTVWLQVDADAVRLTGTGPTAVGARVSATLEAEAALVTVEGQRILEAALLAPGQSLAADVRAAWGEEVTWAATTAEGAVHARQVPVDPHLSVSVSREVLPDGRWRLAATVRDGSGRPVAAQVALRLLDTDLLRTGGRPGVLSRSALVPPVPHGDTVGGVAGWLRHAAQAEALSAALLEEVAREEAKKRAQRAAEGRFADSSLMTMMDEGIILGGSGMGGGGSASGLGSLGSAGRGAGSSGYGRGAGSIAPAITGTRERVLWQVIETDRQGVATVELPRPTQGGTWLLEASAVTVDAVGQGAVTLEDSAAIQIVPPRLQPAGPDARLSPQLVAFNASDVERTCTLDGTRAVIPAHTAAHLSLGTLSAGTSRSTRLDCGPGEVYPVDVVAPLADTAGVWTVAVGPGGGAPMAWLGLAADPKAPESALRAALAGRAALAALPFARGAEADALRARVLAIRRDLLVLVRESSDAQAALEVLRFYAEAGPLLGVPRAELEALSAQVGSPLESSVRVAAELARAQAGLRVDPAVVDALLRASREGQLDAEVSAVLARLLVALGRAAEARPVVKEAGPEAILALRALGDTAGAEAASAALRRAGVQPPPVGDPLRPAWIAAVGEAPGRLRGTVEIGGQRVVLEAGGVVQGVGAALPALPGLSGLLAWQGVSPEPAAGGVVARMERLPVGMSGAVISGGSGGLPEQRRLCGDPCVLRVGEGLFVEGMVLDQPGWTAPGGMAQARAVSGGAVLGVTQPGEWTLEGVRLPGREGPQVAPSVRIVVLPAGTEDARLAGIGQRSALLLAQQHLAAGQHAEAQAQLSGWAGLDVWRGWAPQVAEVRLQAALAGGSAAEQVARFEDLRAVSPEARLSLPEVSAVAQAFAATGRPERAVDVWRAGLSAAFLSEAAVARRVEGVGGLLGSLQVMLRLTERYPDVSVVEDARFLLPQRLAELAEQEPLPGEVTALGVDAVDLRLTAAAWDREFLALYPSSARHHESGYNLVQTLMHLEAYGQAADWASRLAARHPQAPTLDGLLYMEGLAAAELGQDARALSLLERVATESFFDAAGQPIPAPSRDVARFAAARLREARGDLVRAREGYTAIAGRVPAADQALWALSRVLLEPTPQVILQPGEPARLPVLVANVPEVDLRIYQVDLRTLFLRDGGLADARDIAVAGVSPAWAGKRSLRSGPHPEEVEIALPISAPGAWLVQISGGGQESAALVLRSDLTMYADDLGSVRRVSVQRGSQPAPGVNVRAVLPGYGITAATTDLRGVAIVPAGAAVLAFSEDHYAVLDSARLPSRPSPAPAFRMDEGDLLDGLQDRTRKQRESNRQSYEQLYEPDFEAEVEVNML